MGRHTGTKRMDSLRNGYMLLGDIIMTKRFEVQLDYGGNPVNKTYEQQAGVDDWKDAVELAITELLEYERGEREMEEWLHQKEIPEKDVDINYIKEYQ